MGAIKRAMSCCDKCGCNCKGPSSFFKSPFETPKTQAQNTGMIALKIFHQGGNWKLEGVNSFHDGTSKDKTYKK